MRGENKLAPMTCTPDEGSSPHARGKPTEEAAINGDGGAHPRMRGENAVPEGTYVLGNGSSPHARGKPFSSQSCDLRIRLIPACAGKTCSMGRWVVGSRAHPRMRGENKKSQHFNPFCPGSSPHARGKRAGSMIGRLICRLIPACAGKTSSSFSRTPPEKAHPRMRGENQKFQSDNDAELGSSPHARGKLPLISTICCAIGSSPHARGKRGKHRFSRAGKGLIPACAGKTHLLTPVTRLYWAHPRMRGENSPS